MPSLPTRAPALLALLAACGAPELSAPPTVSSAVLVTLDTTRADALGGYGATPSPTPNLDRIAAESLRWDRAWTTVPLTLPSHASMLTGLYPPRHGVRDNTTAALPASAHTLAEAARSEGLETAAFVAAVVLDAAQGLAQGFDTYDSPDASGQRATAHIGALSGDEVVERALVWLAARDASRRFLLWVHLFDPHGPTPLAPDPTTGEPSLRAGYLGEVATMDRALGRLFEGLRTGSHLERALLLVVGDHGEGLGDHGEPTHGSLCYESTLRIPFLVRYPDGYAAGTASDRAVSAADVAPTLAQALGLTLAGELDGESLYRREPAAERGVYFESYYAHLAYGWSPLSGWATAEGKYVHGARPRYWDPRLDPEERRNLLADRRAAVQRARAELRALGRKPALEREAEGATDPALLERIRALGYADAARGPQALPAPGDSFTGRSPEESVALERDLLQAALLGEAGRDAEAVELLERVLTEDDANPFAHARLGTSLLRLGRFADAVPHLERAVEGGPGWGSVLFNLGLCRVESGDLEGAREAFDRACAIDPRNEQELRALAGHLERNGRGEAARALLTGRPERAGDD